MARQVVVESCFPTQFLSGAMTLLILCVGCALFVLLAAIDGVPSKECQDESWCRSKQHVRAVEALRTELEEEEQALDSVSEAGTSELAQDDEADGQANAQTDAVDGQKASGNADSDQDRASPRVSTCRLS